MTTNKNTSVFLNSVLVALLLISFSSCFKEDERVLPRLPGDIQSTTIEMKEDYSMQVFYSLANGEVTSIDKFSWDLALSCKADDYTLFLNTSLFMNAAHTGTSNFDSVYSITNNIDWEYDSSDGDITGNAIGSWWLAPDSTLVGEAEVILIDRGIDQVGIHRGYMKIQPALDTLNKVVRLSVSDLNGANSGTFEIVRNELKPYVTVSFTNGFNDPQPFPDTNNWDLWFTQYTTLLFTETGQEYPYLVTGVLINNNKVQVALDSITPFDSVTIELAQTLVLSNRLDVIGYEWKKVNGEVTSGDVTYTARPEYVYVIKNADGFLYKLRFVDFYNEQGKKGYPKIEYQLL